jgi:hypothetical protein
MKKAGLLDKAPLMALPYMVQRAKNDIAERKPYPYSHGYYYVYKTRKYFRAQETCMEDVLEVDVYTRRDMVLDRKELRFRIFLNNKEQDFITWDCVHSKWSKAKIDFLDYEDKDTAYSPGKKDQASEETKKVVNGFLGSSSMYDVGTAIRQFQVNIRKDALEKQHRLITDAIDERMAVVPNLPPSFEKWVRSNTTEDYIFYKDKTGYCDHCREMVSLGEKPRHNTVGKCTRCGRTIIYKSWCKQLTVQDETRVEILQKLQDGTGYVLRSFAVRKRNKREYGYIPDFYISEDFRDIYSNSLCQERSYEWGEFKSTGITRWCDYGIINHGCYGWYYDRRSSAILYSPNLTRMLADTEIKYMPVAEIIRAAGRKRVEFRELSCMLRGNTGRQYERMYKAGLKAFVADQLISGHTMTRIDRDMTGGKIWGMLGISKEEYRQALRLHADDRKMAVIQRLHAAAVKVTDEQLEWIDRYIGLNVILRSFGIHTPHRMIRYMREDLHVETEGTDKGLHLWVDYLDAAQELQWNLADESIFFPQNIQTAHDEAVLCMQEKKDREQNMKRIEQDKQLKKNAKDIRRVFAYENDEFMVVVPESWKEFKKEANEQHNCVASNYYEPAVNGRTIILFIRRKTEPDKSFCTVEVKRDGIMGFRVAQNRIRYNKDAPKEAVDFLEKVIRSAEKKGRKEFEKQKKEANRVMVAV